MKQIDFYKSQIEGALKKTIEGLELVSNTNNIVFKYSIEGENYFAKFYKEGETHTDNEVLLYQSIAPEGKKYLKSLVFSNVYQESEQKFALYEEVKGRTLAFMLENDQVSDELATKIAKELLNYFRIVSKMRTSTYGNLSNSFEGEYEYFLEYLYEYQFKTTETLFLNPKTRSMSSLPYRLLEQYADILDEGNPCVTPIDSNFRNIMITNNGEIKIIDPGAIVSAPINMGLGELVAHSYGTVIYDKLMEEMQPASIEKKRLSIYGILSSMNIMAFLVRNNIGKIEESKPFGNKRTFFELIEGHLNIILGDNSYKSEMSRKC